MNKFLHGIYILLRYMEIWVLWQKDSRRKGNMKESNIWAKGFSDEWKCIYIYMGDPLGWFCDPFCWGQPWWGGKFCLLVSWCISTLWPSCFHFFHSASKSLRLQHALSPQNYYSYHRFITMILLSNHHSFPSLHHICLALIIYSLNLHENTLKCSQ